MKRTKFKIKLINFSNNQQVPSHTWYNYPFHSSTQRGIGATGQQRDTDRNPDRHRETERK